MKRYPPSLRELRKGDRLILISLDNSRHVVEVTSVGEGRASGKSVGPDGPFGRVEKIYSGSILCREGEPEVRWAGNLVPGDLVYTADYRSGLQYARAVALAGGRGVGLLRWNEAKGEWAKHPQRDFERIEWIAHDSEAGALDRFFRRIEQDRAQWLTSPGRSGHVAHPATGEYSWQQKVRRWRE